MQLIDSRIIFHFAGVRDLILTFSLLCTDEKGQRTGDDFTVALLVDGQFVEVSALIYCASPTIYQLNERGT
jgi:hypothetical protein